MGSLLLQIILILALVPCNASQTLQELQDDFLLYRSLYVQLSNMPARTNQPMHYYRKGQSSLLITAPHTLNHFRYGRYKKADWNTGPVIELLANRSNHHLFFLRRARGIDPYKVLWTPFRKALKKTVDANKEIKLILDLHSAARHREFDIDLGDMHSKSLLSYPWLSDFLYEKFTNCGFKTSRNFFSASKNLTLTRFAREQLALDTVQIEVNSRISDQDSPQLQQFIKCFTQTLEALQKKLDKESWEGMDPDSSAK